MGLCVHSAGPSGAPSAADCPWRRPEGGQRPGAVVRPGGFGSCGPALGMQQFQSAGPTHQAGGRPGGGKAAKREQHSGPATVPADRFGHRRKEGANFKCAPHTHTQTPLARRLVCEQTGPPRKPRRLPWAEGCLREQDTFWNNPQLFINWLRRNS